MIDLYGVIFLLGTGGLAGFLTGFFGVGGGLIMVPALILFLGSAGVSSLVSTHLAVGTSLCVIIFTSVTPFHQARTQGHIGWRTIAFVGAAGLVGAVLGSSIAAGLQGKTLQLILGFLVMLPALQLLANGKTQRKQPERSSEVPALMGGGLAMGFVSSLTGVEGSVPGIPMLYRLMSFPLKEAVGASSAAALAAALASSVMSMIMGWGNTLLPAYTLGFVHCLAAIPLIVGTLPSAAWGVSVARKSPPRRMKKYYGVFLLAIAIKMIIF